MSSPEYFKNILLKKTPIIDVRAPVEFNEGSIPHSVNLPILSDEERKEIGTLYKEKGQDAAIVRGHELVSGAVKDSRIEKWLSFIKTHPDAVVCCFRGGLRSRITCQWLKEAGVERNLIPGGYKAFRRYLIEQIEFHSKQKMLIISGSTGSGKTDFLKAHDQIYRCLHLETLAHHRGSSFGAFPEPQPTQINFENALAAELIGLAESSLPGPMLVEDESRMVGKCIIPEAFFQQHQLAPIILIQEDLETRVSQIYREYIETSTFSPEKMYLTFHDSFQQISRKLGNERFKEVLADLVAAERHFTSTGKHELNRVWIEKILVYYYDPLYKKSLERKNKERFLFRGTKHEANEFLKTKIYFQ